MKRQKSDRTDMSMTEHGMIEDIEDFGMEIDETKKDFDELLIDKRIEEKNITGSRNGRTDKSANSKTACSRACI